MKARPSIPIVTVLIVAANLVAAFAVVVAPDLIQELGFRPDHPTFVTAFSGLFLHANLLHLLGNMVFLAAVGAAVELATGSLRFSIVYFVGGLAGIALHYAFKHGDPAPAPLIGASGCIASCVAYYNARYMSLRVVIAPKFSTSVLTVTGLWMALQLAGVFVQLGQPRAVSFYAHIGGLIAGAALALVFRSPDLGQLDLRHEVLKRMNDRGPDAMIRAAREHLKAHPGDVTALRHLSEAYRDLGDRAEEIHVLLDLLPRVDAVGLPTLLRRVVELDAVLQIADPMRMRLAVNVQRKDPELARVLYEVSLESSKNSPAHADALLALASFERERNLERSNALLQELSDVFPLHPAVELARARGWIS